MKKLICKYLQNYYRYGYNFQESAWVQMEIYNGIFRSATV